VTDRVYIPNSTYGNFIALGLGGLDMSATPRDLRIAGFVASLDQTWNIGPGRTFEVGGTHFGGGGNIDITGDGLVILNADTGADSYSGTLSVSGGTLRIHALEGGDVVVNDGGILDSEAFLPGNLALGSATGAGLVIDPNTAESLNATDLVLAGTNTVYLAGMPAGPATVDVVGFTNITGDETNFALDPATAAKLRNAPTFAATPSSITMEFTAGDSLTWTGATSGDWDINTTANWDNGAATQYFDLDSVVFDDSATNKAISITEMVAPMSTSFTNTAGNDYTLGGGGGIAGAGGLSKTGAGMVTLATANSFTGATSIDGGTLVLDYTGANPIAATSEISIATPGAARAVHDDGNFTLDRMISGDGTLVLNPHQTTGSTERRFVQLTGDNNGFTGALLLEAPLSGTWRLGVVVPSALGDGPVTVENGAQLYTQKGQIYSNPLAITGDGAPDGNGTLGAMRLENNTVWDGAITVTGTPGDSGGTTPDASIGLAATGSASLYGYLDGPITGGDLGLLGYSGSGNEWINLTNANSYGDSIVRANDIGTAGQLALFVGGAGNTTATLGTGDVYLIGGADGKVASLRIMRDDGYSLPGDVLSGGNTAATRLLIDTIGSGVSTNGHTITLGEELRISANANDSVFNIDAGSVVTCDTLNVGHANNRPGTLNQTGGDLIVTGDLNVAYGTGQTSTFNMTGGTLAVDGMLNAGVGGIGVVNLDGGTATLSAGGIGGTGGSQVNLGGATLTSNDDFAATVPINITAASTLDIDGNYVELQNGISGDGDLVLADTSGGGTLVLTVTADTTYDGSLSGPASIEKDGPGTLALGGASTNTGGVTVFQGGLRITGSLSGSDLAFDGGALHTGGSLTGNLSMSTLANSSIEYAGAPLAVTGNVTLGGTTEVNPVSGGALAAGTHPLVTYTGTLTGDSSNLAFPAGFVPGNYRQTFSLAAGGGHRHSHLLGRRHRGFLQP